MEQIPAILILVYNWIALKDVNFNIYKVSLNLLRDVFLNINMAFGSLFSRFFVNMGPSCHDDDTMELLRVLTPIGVEFIQLAGSLKGLFQPAFLARVVSCLTFVCRQFHGP